MALRDSSHLAEFKDALSVWTDQRFVSREELEALAIFSTYLVNLAEEDGWTYCGHSFKVGVVMSCLVVKAYKGDLPLVVFTSARTHTGCVVTFLRKMAAGVLEWREDRFRS